jgi:8-oxo-dGTP pyrophosphatase MutT (NUDIX family)
MSFSLRSLAMLLPQISKASLKDALLMRNASMSENKDDFKQFEWAKSGRAFKPAAVLIAFVQWPGSEGSPDVLLTQRTEHLQDHAGQISFPGGRIDSTDRDAVAAALREAHEETALPNTAVEILGQLPNYYTGTGFEITPVVGWINDGSVLTLQRSEHEVKDVFHVPAGFLLDTANHRRELAWFRGYERTFWSIPWRQPHTRKHRYIWGATAGMLVMLANQLRQHKS